MIKLLFFLLFLSSFTFAQMPNIGEVWLNNSKPYLGTIGNENQKIKVKVNVSEVNKKNDQQYFLAGYSAVDQNLTRFEGKLKITQYKDGKKRSSIYGTYELAEEPSGKHSGIFSGKFIYNFVWNKNTEKIEMQYIQFIGDWKSYDGTLNLKTSWKN